MEWEKTRLSCILAVDIRLDHPLQSVIPSAHGAVLGVLARTSEPLSGRGVAALTRPHFSQSRVNVVLGELARDGIADVEVRPPASYYRLNREHVAAPGVLALASMADTSQPDRGGSLRLVDPRRCRLAVRLRRTS